MKKILVVLLVLVVAGAGVFAADVADHFTLSGDVNSGIAIKAGDATGNAEDTKVVVGNGDGRIGQFSLNGAYTEANYGAEFGIVVYKNIAGSGATLSNDGGTPPVYSFTAASDVVFALDHARVWAKFFDEKLYVQAGNEAGDVPGLEWGPGGGNGLRLNLTPMTGLDVGVWFDGNHPGETIAQFFQETKFGVKYAPGLLGIAVAAGVTLDSDVDGGNAEAAYFTGGVEASPLGDLLYLRVVAKAENLGASKPVITAGAWENLNFSGYLPDGLSAGIDTNEIIPLDDVSKLEVNITPHAGYEYQISDPLKVSAYVEAPLKIADGAEILQKVALTLPKFNITVGAHAGIEAAYVLQIQDAGADYVGHTVSCYFNWSF
jgi:hypothetical protein